MTRDSLKKDVPAIEQLLDYLRRSLLESGCTFMAREDSTRKGKPDGR